jgi:hypothetical protein
MTSKHLEPFLKRRGLIIQKNTYSGGDKEVSEGYFKSMLKKGVSKIDKGIFTIGERIKKKEENLKKGIINTFSPKYWFSVKIISMIRNALRHVSQKNADRKDNETRLETLVITKPIDMEYGGGFLVFDNEFIIKKIIYTGFIAETSTGGNPLFKVTDVEPNINLLNIQEGNTYDINEIVKEILNVIDT